jgi:hypothetical protein
MPRAAGKSDLGRRRFRGGKLALDAQTPLRTLQDLDRLKWIAAEQEGRLRSHEARIEALEQRDAGGGFIAFLARLMERG